MGRAVQGAARRLPREAVGQDKAEFLAVLGSAGSARAAAPKAHAPAPRRRSQEERRSEAEARLLAAALTLLSRKGWVGMTLAEVGEAAGYSRGHATHHFGNMGALLRALTSHIYGEFAQEMQPAPPSPAGLEAVLGYFRVYLGRSDSNSWCDWSNRRSRRPAVVAREPGASDER